MNRSYKKLSRNRSGVVMIIAMIFLAIFVSLSMSMLTMSSINAKTASNHHTGGSALNSSLSGIEFMYNWLREVYMPGAVHPNDRFEEILTYLQGDMAAAGYTITGQYEDSELVAINIASTMLDTANGKSFQVDLVKTENLDIFEMNVHGTSGQLTRTSQIQYNFGTRAHNVFDFGIATRGSLDLQGNIEMSGTNVAVEADVYIESASDTTALTIQGNSKIEGNVYITNPNGQAELQGGQASIGGETLPEALNHVTPGSPEMEFPVPEPSLFEHYIEYTFGPGDNTSSDATYTNTRIPANTNPNFSGNTTIYGILYIESPNVVTFSGSIDITGIIVGDGDYMDNSQTNTITITGNITSYPISDLGEEFGDLRDETGTFLMAPGFGVEFGGNFSSLSGAIAANGITFSGNAGGTINGSVLNYSDEPMVLSGNSDLFFNRSADNEVPAGFGPEIVLHPLPETYEEMPSTNEIIVF
jgi:cytoskeletal protein CcmA (bactofilin family)